MLHSIVYEMLNLKWMLIVYIALIVGVSMLYWLFTSSFAWNNKDIRSFGIVRNLEGKKLIAFALSISRLLFVFVSVIFVANIGIQQAVVLVVMCVAIGLLAGDLLMIPTDILSYAFISIIMLLENMLYQYFVDVEKNGWVIVMMIFLATFAVLYSLHHLIGTYEKLLDSENRKMLKNLLKGEEKTEEKVEEITEENSTDNKENE